MKREWNASAQPVVALLAHEVLEDWLSQIGIPWEDFATRMTGGWWFAYANALRAAGVGTILICTSRQESAVRRFRHAPSGAAVWILPATARYARLRALTDRLERRFGTRAAITRAMRVVAAYASLPRASFVAELRRAQCRSLLVEEYETPRFDVAVRYGHAEGIPVFGGFHGSAAQPALARPLRRGAMRRCAGLIVPVEVEAQRVRVDYGLSQDRVARIPNPLDVDTWRPGDRARGRALLGIPHDARVAIWHGGLDIAVKGLDVLLDAWATILAGDAQLDARLVLVGAGQDARRLDDMLAERQLDRAVVRVDRWVQDVEEMRALLSAADVYVFPSRHEGFPAARLEAMACGLPVVSTDVGGIDAIAPDFAVSGVVVVECAAPPLASAIASLLRDAPLARDAGRRARARVEALFSMPAIGARLRNFLLQETD